MRKILFKVCFCIGIVSFIAGIISLFFGVANIALYCFVIFIIMGIINNVCVQI